MKKLLVLFFVCGILAGCAGLVVADGKAGGQAGESAPPETAAGGERRSIAKVNGVEIPEGSLLKTEELIRAQNLKSGRDSIDSEVRKEALERLVLQELIYQRAVQLGLKADEKLIEEYIGKIKEEAGSDEAYQEFLTKGNLSEKDLRNEAERGILIQDLYDKEVAAKVVVSDAEMRAEYEKEKDKFVIPEKIDLDDVVFLLDPEDSSSIKKAEEVLKLLRDEKKGPSELVSDGTFLVRQVTNPGGTDLLLREAARKLKEGELSGVITVEGNLHIIKLRSYSKEKVYGFDDVKKMIEKNLKAQAAKKLMEEWKSELRKNARIEIYDQQGK